MDKAVDDKLTPHRVFEKETWAALRADQTLPLSLNDLAKLRSLNDPISLEEVQEIYMPLSRLLSMHVEAAKKLHRQRLEFLNLEHTPKTAFVIGIAGSVAVGKSTTARILQALLSRWPSSPKVDLVTTDGFLHPNKVLEEQNLMSRKGFPESYDLPALLRFLSDIKAGKARVEAPVYSHFSYDIVPDEKIYVEQPDILILEGLNVLQTRALPKDGEAVPFVSDCFDFSVYIDADEKNISQWYLERFMKLKDSAFHNPESYFHHVAAMSHKEAREMGEHLWNTINRVNLVDNIQPTRPRASLILRKDENHMIESVSLRRL
ncbi:MAG: type I pantothenate kinase [Hyphomicrobiales bacterium]